MSDISNLRDTIIPKSDQLNSEQLLGGTLTITVENVRRGDTAEQPIAIDYIGGNGRPYKPCKTMRKLLIALWGEDGRAWVGRSMVLYNNPDVKFGGVKVGGIRISHMSDINTDTSLSLTETKGKKAQYTVRKLVMKAPTADAEAVAVQSLELASGVGMDALKNAWASLSADMRKRIGSSGLDHYKQLATQADSEHAEFENPRDPNHAAFDGLNAAAQNQAQSPAQAQAPAATAPAPVQPAPQPAQQQDDGITF